MNTKNFKVEVLNKMDSTKEAWLTSKPTITYIDEKDLNDTVEKMRTQDLPLAAFEEYHLRIESSILFRDLLFTIRPCIAWSSSFRINPITPERVAIESNDQWTENDLDIIDNCMQVPYEQFKNGEPLDHVKLGLFLGTMTQYVIAIDSRTLMCLIATLHELDEIGFSSHITSLCKVLGYSSYDELPKTAAKSLYSKLSTGDITNYSDLEPDQDYEISEYYTNELAKVGILQAIVNASTGGQFLRQHFSLMRCQLFDLVKEYGYVMTMMRRCSDRVKYISVGQIENFHQLASRRICWAANWDWEYKKSGVESWSDIIKPIICDMSIHDFAKLLPCKLAWKNCSVSEETRLRLWKTKGQEGVVPDSNPCCPLLIGDPKQVERRKKFYGSDSSIMRMWEQLVDSGWIKECETTWSKENQHKDIDTDEYYDNGK